MNAPVPNAPAQPAGASPQQATQPRFPLLPGMVAFGVTGVLAVALILVLPKDLPASPSASASQQAVTRPTWQDQLKGQMSSAIDDGLAAKLREMTHPTGDGGTVAKKEVRCSDTECTAYFDVAWKGGFTSSKYVTSVRWAVDRKLTSEATIERETSVISADLEHTRRMADHLQELAGSWSSIIGEGSQ